MFVSHANKAFLIWIETIESCLELVKHTVLHGYYWSVLFILSLRSVQNVIRLNYTLTDEALISITLNINSGSNQMTFDSQILVFKTIPNLT